MFLNCFEGPRRFEEVRGGSSRFVKIKEASRKLEKVREGLRKYGKKSEKVLKKMESWKSSLKQISIEVLFWRCWSWVLGSHRLDVCDIMGACARTRLELNIHTWSARNRHDGLLYWSGPTWYRISIFFTDCCCRIFPGRLQTLRKPLFLLSCLA